ncbi:type II secretion system protein [uncultured Amnibacterium sp.]|uniref:type II secretion system protein n=1 Tax=uncultured Amnibacterium sp. TaxID=1631851 RepID=UPI0035CA2650
MSIATALESRRALLREREAGFTLIELLVVVIIIGILAAIAIPVYIGVQNNAKDAQARSDLGAARTAYFAYATAQQKAPVKASFATDLKDYGYAASGYRSGAAPTMVSGTTATLCLTATSDTATVYYIKETGAASTTVCT